MANYRQKNGLTVYALACGYIQRVEGVIDGREIRVDLWQEGQFQVRAHDFTRDGRLDWITESSIGDARYHFKRLINQLFGPAIKSIKSDSRYRVAREFTGEGEPSYVARFCDKWIGKADTIAGAFIVAHQYEQQRQRDLEGV